MKKVKLLASAMAFSDAGHWSLASVYWRTLLFAMKDAETVLGFSKAEVRVLYRHARNKAVAEAMTRLIKEAVQCSP